MTQETAGAETREAPWTEEDEKWFAGMRYPEVLLPLAIRHGRMKFALAMQGGLANVAVARLARQIAGNKAGTQALRTLVHVVEGLFWGIQQAHGVTRGEIEVVQRDIELLGELTSGQDSAGVSPGGIILNS